MRVLAVLLVLLLAGCGTPAPDSFDGEAALAWAKELALNEDGSPRYRIPGSVGQRLGAEALREATDLPGWERSESNFTYGDYLALNRSTVSAYDGGAYCSREERMEATEMSFRNLLAIKRSATPGAPLVLLGAHWDSQPHSDNDPDPSKRRLPDPGANDGASGVGVLLQLMRELDARPALPFSVGILLLDGEDGFYACYALAGSLHFAQNLSEPVAAFVLLDMVGDAGARYPKEGNSMRSAPELVELMWGHAQADARGKAHFTDATVTISDDHLAFIQQGIRSVDIIDAGRATTFPPQWNTAGDTVEKLDPAMLGLVGDVLLRALSDPAFSAWLASPASA